MHSGDEDLLLSEDTAGASLPLVCYAEAGSLGGQYGKALARNLGAALEVSGLTRRGLGSLAGVSHTTINRLLRGEGIPDTGVVCRLELALKCVLWSGPMSG